MIILKVITEKHQGEPLEGIQRHLGWPTFLDFSSPHMPLSVDMLSPFQKEKDSLLFVK